MDYLDRFSPNLAELTAPLRTLTTKDIDFHWEKHHKVALEAIKKELSNTNILPFYDMRSTTKTILQCDASMIGVGAWIRQIGDDGKQHIVDMMGSRSFTETESRDSQMEHKCVGVQCGGL